MLGVEVAGVSQGFDELPVESYGKMLRDLSSAYPNLKIIASTLRTAHTASENGWGANCAAIKAELLMSRNAISTYSTVWAAAILLLRASYTVCLPARMWSGP